MNLTSKQKVTSVFNNRWKLALFFARHLPMAFLAGLNIISFDKNHATVSIPYKYLTKNPFRSIYFACQSMAAELSTAIICLQSLEKFDADLSLLVIKLEAEFTKKANDTISFTCLNEENLDEIFKECITENTSQSLTLKSTGIDQNGDSVAEFNITWSFKPRS
jgi:hypothetical protein